MSFLKFNLKNKVSGMIIKIEDVQVDGNSVGGG